MKIILPLAFAFIAAAPAQDAKKDTAYRFKPNGPVDTAGSYGMRVFDTRTARSCSRYCLQKVPVLLR